MATLKYLALNAIILIIASCTTSSEHPESKIAQAMLEHKMRQAKPAITSYAGGDGSSLENAVIIVTNGNTFDGINAENIWISQNYPDHRKISQKLLNKNFIVYDRIGIENLQGERKDVFFNINSFFGKQ